MVEVVKNNVEIPRISTVRECLRNVNSQFPFGEDVHEIIDEMH